MVKRTLIATALEETWPSFETPVIFLGEWCKIFNRKRVWDRFDSQTLSYHWDDRRKFKNDYYRLERLYEEVLLPDVAKNLNQIHGLGEDLQYWRILIGPWLGYFTHILFDRYEVVRSAFNDPKNLDLFKFLEFDLDEITPNDSADFFSLHITDYWNQYIYQKVIEEVFPQSKENHKPNVPIKRVRSISGHKQSFFFRCREQVKNLFYSFMSYPISDQESFFIGDYLPWRISFLLQLMLGTIPRKRRYETLPSYRNQNVLRSKWATTTSTSSWAFEDFIKKMLPLQIPKVFIEGFTSLQNELLGKKWPSRPKLIFTSNSHVDNDLFKLFSAEKRKSGVPLILSQHGGFYGIGEFSFLEEHETSIADTYLTWGWTKSGKTNLLPVGCTKLASIRAKTGDQEGNAILVLNGMPRYSYYMFSIPQSTQHRLYLEDQWSFVDSLSENVRKKLTVRFYPQDYGWCQEERWKERFPTLDYMEKSSDLEKVLHRFRIYISTYNATTYLESFYKNIPTIIYWDPKYWEIRAEAKPYFKLLEKAGIFHSNPRDASKFLVEHWDRIHLWWNQEDVQNARIDFLNGFCKKINNPVRTLSAQLKLLSKRNIG